MFYQPAADASPADAPLIQPLHNFVIPPANGWEGESLIMPDGLTTLIVEPAKSVNLWNIASYSWPEIFLLVAVLWLGWKFLTVFRRRPQRACAIDGAPLFYCRRCNYDLSEPAKQEAAAQKLAARCPECGVEKLAERGRNPIQRIRWSVAIFAAALLVAGWAWMRGPGIRLWFSDLVSLESEYAAQWLKSHPLVYGPGASTGRRTAVHQIDVATGRTTRTYYLPGMPYLYQFAMAPGGRYVVYQGSGSTGSGHITLLDTSLLKASTVAKLKRFVRLAGLSSDGKRLYYADDFKPTQLMRLETESGQSVVHRAWPMFPADFSFQWAFVFDQNDEVTEAFFAGLSGGTGLPDWPVRYKVVTKKEAVLMGSFGDADFSASRSFMDAADRTIHLGLSIRTGNATRVFDMRTGKVARSKQELGDCGPCTDLGSAVYFRTTPGRIDVLSRGSDKQVCSLKMNDGEILTAGRVSADGLFIVAQMQTGRAGVPTSVRVWRLPVPFKPSM